jgi:hypothetical protein
MGRSRPPHAPHASHAPRHTQDNPPPNPPTHPNPPTASAPTLPPNPPLTFPAPAQQPWPSSAPPLIPVLPRPAPRFSISLHSPPPRPGPGLPQRPCHDAAIAAAPGPHPAGACRDGKCASSLARILPNLSNHSGGPGRQVHVWAPLFFVVFIVCVGARGRGRGRGRGRVSEAPAHPPRPPFTL